MRFVEDIVKKRKLRQWALDLFNLSSSVLLSEGVRRVRPNLSIFLGGFSNPSSFDKQTTEFQCSIGFLGFVAKNNISNPSIEKLDDTTDLEWP